MRKIVKHSVTSHKSHFRALSPSASILFIIYRKRHELNSIFTRSQSHIPDIRSSMTNNTMLLLFICALVSCTVDPPLCGPQLPIVPMLLIPQFDKM